MTESTVKTPNYTDEQVAELVAAYTSAPVEATVEAFASKFGKTVRSIVAKLAREGVYHKKEYVSKTGAKPITKADMVAQIAALTGDTEDNLTSLEKATKHALTTVIKALEAAGKDNEAEFEALDA